MCVFCDEYFCKKELMYPQDIVKSLSICVESKLEYNKPKLNILRNNN